MIDPQRRELHYHIVYNNDMYKWIKKQRFVSIQIPKRVRFKRVHSREGIEVEPFHFISNFKNSQNPPVVLRKNKIEPSPKKQKMYTKKLKTFTLRKNTVRTAITTSKDKKRLSPDSPTSYFSLMKISTPTVAPTTQITKK